MTHQCDMEVRICEAETSFWSRWSRCVKLGNHYRVRCSESTHQCAIEERTCIFQGVVPLVQTGDGTYLAVEEGTIEIEQQETLVYDTRSFEDEGDLTVDDGSLWHFDGEEPFNFSD